VKSNRLLLRGTLDEDLTEQHPNLFTYTYSGLFVLVRWHDEHNVQTVFWEDRSWEEIGRMPPQPRQPSVGTEQQQPCIIRHYKLEMEDMIAFQESKKAYEIEILRNNNSALNHSLKWQGQRMEQLQKEMYELQWGLDWTRRFSSYYDVH